MQVCHTHHTNQPRISSRAWVTQNKSPFIIFGLTTSSTNNPATHCRHPHHRMKLSSGNGNNQNKYLPKFVSGVCSVLFWIGYGEWWTFVCVCTRGQGHCCVYIYNVLLLNGGPCCVCPPIISRATHMKIISLLFISPSNDSTWFGVHLFPVPTEEWSTQVNSVQLSCDTGQDKSIKRHSSFPRGDSL